MKFLHVADCHLGCRQYGMRAREEDFYRAFASAADIAAKEKVDAMVIAGDLFDAVKPTAEAVCVVKEVVTELKASGIRTLGIEGNHDLTGNNYWLRVCGIEPLDGTTREVKGIKLSGLNYLKPDDLVKTLSEISEQGETDVMVLHSGFAELGDSFGGISVHSILPQLKKMQVKYVALGHIHTPMEPVVDGVHFVQPGSTELKDISEPTTKYAMLVEISGNSVAQTTVPLRTRPVEILTIDSEEKLHEVLEGGDVRNAFDGRLVVAYVANSIHDGAARVEEMMKRHEVLFRMSVYDNKAGQAPQQYERSSAIPTLVSAVDAYFDRGSEQHALVSEILRTPGNLRHIVENYLNRETA